MYYNFAMNIHVLPDPYVEILMLNMLVLGGEAFGE